MNRLLSLKWLLIVGGITCVPPWPAACAQDAPFFQQIPFLDMAENAAAGKSPFQWNDDQMRAVEEIQIPVRQEKSLGKRQVANYERSLREQGESILRSGREVGYLTGLVKKIQPLMKNASRYRKIQVYYVESDRFDARMFPGGHLYVFRGLLKEVDNEATMVGVLGHECSHLDHGHQLFELRRNKMLQKGFGGPDRSFVNMMKQIQTMATSFARPFRPEEESVADADGVRWAHQLGYDPREFAKFFEKLAAKNGKGNDQPFDFFKTHPGNQKRFLDTRELAQSLINANPDQPLLLGKENFLTQKN